MCMILFLSVRAVAAVAMPIGTIGLPAVAVVRRQSGLTSG